MPLSNGLPSQWLTHSGMQTWLPHLHMCRCGSLVFFCHVQSVRYREGVDRLCAWTYRKPQNKKEAKAARNLLHVCGYQWAKIIHTEHWMHSWLNYAQELPFCSKKSGSILIMSWSLDERYQTFPAYKGNCHFNMALILLSEFQVSGLITCMDCEQIG